MLAVVAAKVPVLLPAPELGTVAVKVPAILPAPVLGAVAAKVLATSMACASDRSSGRKSACTDARINTRTVVAKRVAPHTCNTGMHQF